MDAPDTRSRLARWVHYSLRAGVVASGLLLGAGLVAGTVRGRPPFQREPLPPGAALAAAAAGDGAALIDLGLLVLMATPVVRVAVLAVGWAAAGDRRFAAVAAAVLALLGVSLYLGVG